MKDFVIHKLSIEDFGKCSNIWNMELQRDLALRFYSELISGNRIIFVGAR